MITQADTVRLRRMSSKKAIDLAMEGRWREAVDANRSLIESFSDDVDAYNRLGRAYMELGDFEEAREAYSQALKIDPYNAIARKNFGRLKLTAAQASEDSFHRVDPHSFIEETGKAGVVSLYRLAPPHILAGMVAGDVVELSVKKRSLTAQNGRGEYVGMVEPKHANRLIRLMNGGNRYAASVVSVGETALSIIIREVYQHPDQFGLQSFPPRGVEKVKNFASERGENGEEREEEEGEEYSASGERETEDMPFDSDERGPGI